ncbi:unnamed protein product [Dibothriocephalus latus]|uniref:BOS complex subunit TMEM147 n=1 Tax=Dibothriocephalus latus TaxID=60516 RepID=A0A3P7MNA3_DIBLA|nr:unnamed protein product [Dibothriocephalus latus]
MGFFHLINCLVLATGPHIILYKTCGMSMMPSGGASKSSFFMDSHNFYESSWQLLSISTLTWHLKPDSLTTYIPIWVGTKDLEFDWAYLSLSFDANIDLVCSFGKFASINSDIPLHYLFYALAAYA